MEEPEERRFEDFTNASEWENFTSRFEEVLCLWKLHKDGRVMSRQTSQVEGQSGRERISIGPFSVVVALQEDSSEHTETGDQVLRQLCNNSNDFPPRAHCIRRWFGVHRFIVITSSEPDVFVNDNQAKLILSSASIALNNTKCCVPVFVSVQQSWRRMYTGVCVTQGKLIWFDTVHLRYAPPQFSHLTGMIEVFKSKVGQPSVKVPVVVSVHFTYVLRDFDLFCWPQLPPDFDKQDKKGVIAEISEFPFGTTSDPVSELHLSTTWPSLTEDVVVDNSVYSDLDPMEAPRWTLRVRYEKQTCLMEECLTQFLKLSDHHQGIEEIIGQIPSTSSEPDNKLDIAGALQRLTNPHLPSTLSGVVNATASAAFSEDESPFSPGMMDTVMKYLFPGSGEECASDLDPRTCEENSVPPYKTAPFGSLTYRLAVALCLANHNFGGVRAIAYLWREIVLELRYRWEHGHLLPSLAEEAPNLHYSLLHQKLQMLNHCIRQKQKQQASRCGHINSKLQKTVDLSVAKEEIDEADEKSDSSDNDEFFEAVETPDQLLQSDGNQSVTESDGWEAEGILHQLGSEVLISNGHPLYVPQTQEPLVMTEDMVNELSERLSQLGTSEKAAKMRARMQSAQLVSDMQAFKAANPGCVLADFVRWYSPRDWLTDDLDCEKIEELPAEDKTTSTENEWDIVDTDVPRDDNPSNSEGTKVKDEPSDGQAPFVQGHLSARMEQPGNFWQEVWEDVGPQPVRRQKRLFDDTVEAEKVLHMFSGLSVRELVFLLLPMILHHAVSKLQDQQGRSNNELEVWEVQVEIVNAVTDLSCLTSIQGCISSLRSSLSRIALATAEQHAEFEKMVKQISKTEILVSRAKSLMEKLLEGISLHHKHQQRQNTSSKEEIRQVIDDLLTQPETLLRGAARGCGGQSVLGILQRRNKSSITSNDKECHSHLYEGPKVAFPSSVGREFILRLQSPMPSAHLDPIPHRMYCVLAPDEFRLAGAFTSHVTFH